MTGAVPMTLRPRRTSVVLAVTFALLTVCVLGNGLATASSLPATSSPPTWAYGAIRTVDFHGLAGLNLSGTELVFVYTGAATFGFSTIFNETRNTTDGNVTVNIVRTLGARIDIRYCFPDCATPKRLGVVSFVAWETTDAWSNLTTRGNVTSGGSPVPALAIVNSSLGVRAAVQESGNSSHGGVILRDRTFDASISGRAAVGLSPALGLVPFDLSPGATWNSTSAFHLSGSLVWAWDSTASGTLVGTSEHNGSSGTASLTTAGRIDLNGSYLPGSDFGFQGTKFPAVELNLSGPFALGEGAVLVPAATDMFGAGEHLWSTDQEERAIVTASTLDIHPGRYYHGHLPFVASAVAIDSSTQNVAADLVAAGPDPALSAIPETGGNSTFVQGLPESVAGAQGQQNCLVTGLGCGTLGGPRIPLRLFFLAGVGTVAVAAIAVVVTARRRPPVPVSPNAALYPPGASPVVPPRPGPPLKPADDDPLDHLW